MLVNSLEADTISIQDRGLLYGDGIFETILCDSGRPTLLAGHIQRLVNGCKRLGLPVQDLSAILADIRQVAAEDTCIIKVIVTRGVRSRGYGYDKQDNTATRIVYRDEKVATPIENYSKGIQLFQCQHTLPINSLLAGIKHLNRLDQVLARSEWDKGFQEGLMLDQQGHVVEGTMTNIFLEAEHQWVTPKLEHAGVAGVMRQWVMRNAFHASMECVEKDINITDVKNADSMFVCNSVIGIWPVRQFGEAQYSISQATVDIMQYIHQNISELYSV